MPRGNKSSYSPKQKQLAAQIEKDYEKKGASKKDAARIAWSTVNKITGGARRKQK